MWLDVLNRKNFINMFNFTLSLYSRFEVNDIFYLTDIQSNKRYLKKLDNMVIVETMFYLK